VSLRVTGSRFAAARVWRSLSRILRENVLCAMATVSRVGRAHVHVAYFCHSDEPALYFLSDPRSHHIRNLSRRRTMAVAVYRSNQRWGGPDRGLQLFGTCSEARGASRREAERLYARRFPGYAGWRARSAADVVSSLRFYRFVPRKVRILDEAEFGDGVFVDARF
jgi:uncharacterized protein YhbP (UPF0306 family)